MDESAHIHSNRECRKAWSQLHSWCLSLAAFQAANTSTGNEDPSASESQKVEAEELLAVFLELHPEHVGCRDVLLEHARKRCPRSLDKRKWAQEKPKADNRT